MKFKNVMFYADNRFKMLHKLYFSILYISMVVKICFKIIDKFGINFHCECFSSHFHSISLPDSTFFTSEKKLSKTNKVL